MGSQMKVKLEKHDPEWKSLFEIEKRELIKVLNSKEIKIEHMGSTSIPNIYSKPVIDIMIGVKEEKQLDSYINEIISLGYTYVQKYEIYMPFRRYFFKLKDPEVQLPEIIGFDDEDIDKENHEDRFHIHLVKINSDFWINQLLFRNYLRNNHEAKDEYENLKKSLAKREWDSVNDYAEAKSEVITKILENAKKNMIETENKLKYGREKRGKVSNENIKPYLTYSTEKLIILLREKEAQKRTIAATVLGENKSSDKKVIGALCSSLKSEKALYSRIALSEALAKIGEPAVPYLVDLLGKIGSNQEKELPKKYFNKKGYPLPRDMAARTLVKVGEPATPYLIESLEIAEKFRDEFKIQQILDAIGGIAAKTGDHRAFHAIENIIQKHQHDPYNNEVTSWKITRALSGFKSSKKASDLLLNILKETSNPPIIWEAVRSLGQIGVFSHQIIDLIQDLGSSEHSEISKAAKQALIQITAKN